MLNDYYENNSLTQLMVTILDKYIQTHEMAAFLPLQKKRK